MATTPEQIESLVKTILSGPSIERPSALFELLKLVMDPGGDEEKYESALSALRTTDPFTREYEAWFQGRICEVGKNVPIARM